MTSILEAALDYSGRGWKLCAVYPVDDGVCTCERGPACKHSGKHPRGRDWQRAGRPPTYWQRSHDNIGIITGRPSGFWVLDFDPGAALDDGNILASTLRRTVGEPQVTTGGHGWHWRFRMPDGRDVVNGQNGVGALPAGFDVRGTGGMVVAPPSRSGKGAYVETGAGVLEAPGWLYALMDERRAPADQVGAQPQGTPPLDHHDTPVAPIVNRPGAWEYFNGALARETSEYAQLTDGRRGEAMAAFARALVEIVNGANAYGVRWSYDQAYQHFEAAALAATANRPDGGYAPHELPGQWHRAIAHVNERGGWRRMPDAPEALPPFQSAPGSPAPSSVAAGTPVLHEIGSAPPPTPPAITEDQRIEQLARAMLERERARALVERWKLGDQPSIEDDLIAADALDLIPDPVPVVDGWLFADSLARINGRPGQGKSFVAVDLAAHVASGRPWHGNAVARGDVLYVAAEGLGGLKLRVRAWENAHGVKLGAGLVLLRRAVQVAGPEWPAFIEVAARRRPAMIVLDTQARVTAGLNENQSVDMGTLIVAVEALRAATGALVLLIHHKGKGDAEGGRGSNAVEGAMMSEFDVWKRGTSVTIRNTRQKEIEIGSTLEFTLRPEASSAVLVRQIELNEPNSGTEIWKEQARSLYAILKAHSGAAGISRTDAKAQFVAPIVDAKNTAKYAGTLFGYAWNNLVMRGLVIQHTQSKHFGVHVMERVGLDGVLTPNVGEWEVSDPTGWHTWAPDAVDPGANWAVDLGRTGGTRVSEAVRKMRA